MISLLLVLAGIALVDATSIVPIGIVPLAALLGGPRPVLGAVAFLAGIFAVYLLCGVVILLGLNVLVDAIGPTFARLWNEPLAVELAIQIVLGVVLVVFGWRLARRRGERAATEPAGPVAPGRAFSLGAVLTLVGMPGAVPYFGAIDQVLRADLSPTGTATALVVYNVVFLVPLASLLLVRVAVPTRSEAIFAGVAAVAERGGRALIVALLALLGLVLAADGVGWFLGSPLLPVGGATTRDLGAGSSGSVVIMGSTPTSIGLV